MFFFFFFSNEIFPSSDEQTTRYDYERLQKYRAHSNVKALCKKWVKCLSIKTFKVVQDYVTQLDTQFDSGYISACKHASLPSHISGQLKNMSILIEGTDTQTMECKLELSFTIKPMLTEIR